MKANLKGMRGIKGFLLLHGEKIAMIGVGVCTALFLYYSLSVERLQDTYQADDLQREINQTRSAVESFDWNTAVSDHPAEIRLVKPIATSGNHTVDPANYLTSKEGWDVPVVRPTVLRTDPELLAAVDVRAVGGSGQIPFIDDKLRKEREIKRQAEAEQQAKELAEKQKKDAEEESQQRGTFRFDDDERGRFGGARAMDFERDPEHPKRRPIEGMTHLPGAMVQGDERIVMASWAVVVAKVPIREQLKLFRTAFEQTRSGFEPSMDFPRYAGYQVQRAEVLPGKELQWADVAVYDGQGNRVGRLVGRGSLQALYDKAVTKTWGAESPEVVAEQYLDDERVLVYPLPPLLHRDWGAEATHPDIPLAIDAPPMEEELELPLEEPVKKPTDPKDDDQYKDFGSTDQAQGGGYVGGAIGRGFGQRGMGFPGRGGDMDDQMFRMVRPGAGSFPGMRPMRGMDREDMMMGAMGRGGGYGGGRRFGSGPSGRTTLPKSVNEWLLRFIDFDVQPGKKYKYRVRLAVDDPNQGSHLLGNKVLDPKVLNRLRESAKTRGNKGPLPVRFAEWSAPSPTVGIPLSGSVRLASAKPLTGNLFNEEPSATLLIESFTTDEEGNAIFGAIEKELRRGFVANTIEDTEYLVSDGRSIDTMEKFRFMTGTTVVDVRGGEKLTMTKDMQTPSRVLLMDPSGELVIRSELDDADSVRLHKAIFAKPKKRMTDMDDEMMRGRGGFRFDRDR